MSVQILDAGYEPTLVNMEEFDEDNLVGKRVGLDARRRLEDRREDLRLQKEIQEFDFDL